ncbi:hypothetical protein AC249_AIPGENE26143 [Exaiptasia diaphana]|nr:hypothetical protein AC249_AIPGENE26143 [Exaiptasia diaphana]
MEDNIEEFEFSEWTDSLEDEFMETESALVHGSMQNNITQPLEKNNGRCIENRDLKSRKLSCLGESCQGKMFHIQENSLLSGYLRSLDGMAESSNEPIIQLFGSKFAAGSALACKTDTLFYLLS